MSGKVDSLAPKRVRKAESPEVSGNQATAQAAHAFTPDWSELPEGLIPKIGVFLNVYMTRDNLITKVINE